MYDAYFDIEGVPGESEDSKYKDKITVVSFGFDAKQAGTFSYGSGGGAGKVDFKPFKFTKVVDTASHLLFLCCAEGRHIAKATLYVRKSGGGLQDFLKITFTDLIISSYNLVGEPTADRDKATKPTEEIEIQFSSIKLSYSKQKNDGTQEAFKEAGWSVKENRKL
ncbi:MULTISPECIES: type VI secretion system tube protein Hcp [unclassified Azospirillum]|uniref:Hcp family type VI secretion system effector n=1 Tax=unclassified Azospirillum TaxID=2630922 RepID=UPI000B700DA7|nr:MULTISPECIES: type VI secretion system tube protein Hcp [unclassified Azospirillum]SNS92389.1 type VI secretion system secreted protein Hcp [Azospirillum sp. RU38E]SNT09325.1 type VI secretion system secreted protein Hcp [Azospirillum sp. RU37A]